MTTAAHLKTITTPYGSFTIDVEIDRKIANGLAAGHHQRETLELLRHFVTKQSTVVDIGAHVGTLAVPLATWAAQAIAFEPAPETYALLCRNVEQNNVVVDARNKGLSRASGHATLVSRDHGNAGSQTLHTGVGSLVISTLDEEVAHADVIKIDTEGMELEVLEGGSALIARSRPVVLFEVNLSQLRAHGASPRMLERYFAGQHYRLYVPLGAGSSLHLGSVGWLGLLTACIAPRAWLLQSQSAPFDILALPAELQPPLPTVSFATVLWGAVCDNFNNKITRLKRVLRGERSTT